MKRALAVVVLAFATTLFAGSQVTAKHAALATSSPVATSVGVHVLQDGGNAADAAVAVGFVLGVAQPHASGLGGGGVAMYYDAKTKGVWMLDFREAAPDAVKRDMFSVKPSRIGPLTAGVPGMVAGLGALHERFGSKSWRELLAPAIALARDGTKVDVDAATALLGARTERQIDQFKSTADLFVHDAKPLKAGDTLVQGDLAATLDRIAQHGSRDFYIGETAKKLVDAIHDAGGVLGDKDLRVYAAEWRAPMRIAFRGFDICAPAPPSSGGFLIAESLAILGRFDPDGTVKSIHTIAEAERRASMDADKYLGDPALTRIPYRELLSEDRAKTWRASIKADRSTPTTMLTEPASIDSAESPHTTHFTIVDAAGNVAAVTLTLDDDFGGGFVVPGLGFALNDALHDFTANANAMSPCKRPMTSMTPLIVLKSGAPFLAAGSTGGAAMPTTMLNLLLDITARRMPLGQAVSAPRYHQDARSEDIAYERDKAPKSVITALGTMGHGVHANDPIGDVNAVLISDKIVAVADPRHGGAAGGY